MGTAVIFPGQGTQQPGMGAPWVDDPAWDVVERAEHALGEKLAPLILDEGAPLTRTRDAQLAVLVTSLVCWEAVRTCSEVEASVFAGHSLGQVTALIASGAVAFDDGVRFAARRAELTQEAANRHPGRMIACIGADTDQAEKTCRAAPNACWIANDNAPGQIVLAGTPEGIEVATNATREAGIRRVLPLDVGGAFHTPLMNEASEALAVELTDLPFVTGSAPVVSNEDATAYNDADGWRVRLARHVVRPVRWRSVMETLVDRRADPWLEVGYGSMLAGLAKRGAKGVHVRGVATPRDLDHLDAVRT